MKKILISIFLVLSTLLYSDISLRYGNGKEQVGVGYNYNGIKGFQTIENVPSFTVFNSRIFILDALNFRILVYDYTGKYIKTINYPQKNNNGDYNIMSDIASNEKSIFLAAYFEKVVYQIDYNGKVKQIITGADTRTFSDQDILKNSSPRPDTGSAKKGDIIAVDSKIFVISKVDRDKNGKATRITFNSKYGYSYIYVDNPKGNLAEQRWDVNGDGKVGVIDKYYVEILKNSGLVFPIKPKYALKSKGGFNFIDMIALNNRGDLLIRDYDRGYIYFYKETQGKYRLFDYNTIENNMFFDSQYYSYPIDLSPKTVNVYKQKEDERKLFCDIKSRVFIDKCNLVGIDQEDNIYIHFVENAGGEEGMTENPGAAYIKVFSKEGKFITEYKTIAWPGNEMIRFIDVDEKGKIFVAELNDDERAFNIKQLN